MTKLFHILVSLAVGGVAVAQEKTYPRAHEVSSTVNKDASREPGDKAYWPALVDLVEDKNTPTHPDKLLPNRLYKRWEPVRKGWIFDVTNPDGKFDSDPRRRLTTAFVLKGFGPKGKEEKVYSTLPGPFVGGNEKDWYIYEIPKAERKSWRLIPNPNYLNEENHQPGTYYLADAESLEEEVNVKPCFHSTRKEDK